MAAKCKLLQLTFPFYAFLARTGSGNYLLEWRMEAEIPAARQRPKFRRRPKGCSQLLGPNFGVYGGWERGRGRAEQLRLPYVVAYDLPSAALEIEISVGLLLPVLRADPPYKSCKGLALPIRNLPTSTFSPVCIFSGPCPRPLLRNCHVNQCNWRTSLPKTISISWHSEELRWFPVLPQAEAEASILRLNKTN